jgi:hypothetical protein
VVAPAAHVPLPSHVEGAVAVPFVQEPGAQVVPAITGPQTPSIPCPFAAAVHASQGCAQLELQQTPPTQKPDAHAAPVVQDPPLATGVTHVPMSQRYPLAQSAFVAQVVSQAPAAQAKGVQSTPPAMRPQVPMPSHVCILTTLPMQSVAPHIVPAA